MPSEPSPVRTPPASEKDTREKKSPPLAPWAIRTRPARGDDDPQVTFAAVGNALTQWAHYETALSRLFSAFIALDRDTEAGRRAFGAVRTFEGRLDMLRATADIYFATFPDATLQTDWVEAQKLGKKYGERRNEIAHGAVLPLLSEKPTPDGASDGVCLAPAQIDPKKRDVRGVPLFYYNAASLNHYADEFSKLKDEPYRIARTIVERAQTSREKFP